MYPEKKKISEIVAELGPAEFLPRGNSSYIPVHLWPISERIPAKIRPLAPKPGRKTLAVCFGGFSGLTLAAALKADAVLMLDANPFQPEVYNQVIFPLIRKCETAGEFRKALQSHIAPAGKGGQYLASNGLGPDNSWKVRGDAETGAHSFSDQFFNDKKLYKRLRDMLLNGEAAAAPANAFHQEKCGEIGSLLHDNGYAVGAIYSSNIGSSYHFYSMSLSKMPPLAKPKSAFGWPKDIGNYNPQVALHYPSFMESLFLLSNKSHFRHFHSDDNMPNGPIAEAVRTPPRTPHSFVDAVSAPDAFIQR